MTAALLTVCLCVPAFAVDNTEVMRVTANGVTHELPVLPDGYLNTGHLCIVYDGKDFYVMKSAERFTLSTGSSGINNVTALCVGFLELDSSTDSWSDFGASGNYRTIPVDGFLWLRSGTDYYETELGYTCEPLEIISTADPDPAPGDDEPVEDVASPGVLSSITALVTSSIDWISSFVLCIITNPLLLIFVVSIFVALGLYLLKRSIHL